jgi:hypothetical protein
MAAPADAFAGDLALIGLFDLGQLLCLNRATGTLGLTHGGLRGFLVFEDGQLVNALDDERREGEAAACRLLAWRQGRFEFHPGAPTATRLIECGTEALLLEAARRLDEQAGQQAGEPRAEERLRERQSAMEALRQAFHHAVRDVRGGLDAARIPAAGLLDGLAGAGERLLVRPGRPALLLADGRWRPATSGALERAEYEPLRDWLLEGAGDEAEHVVELGPDRSFAVSRIAEPGAESLWVRRVALDPPAPADLDGPLEELVAAIDRPVGLLLAGGPTPMAADRLLHALAALAAERRGGTVLIVSDDAAWRTPEANGPVLRVGHAAAAARLALVQPDVLALSAARLPSREVLRQLPGVPLLLVAVVAAEDDRLLPRWEAMLAAAGESGVARLAAASPGGLVQAGAASDLELALRFTFRPLPVPAAGEPCDAAVSRASKAGHGDLDLSHLGT